AHLPGLPPVTLPLFFLRGLLGALAVIAAQLVLAMVIRSFAVPIFLGLLGGITGIFISSKGHGLLWPYSLMQLGMNSNKSADVWRAATGCLLSAASSGWGRCSFWHGCFYAGRMCGHKAEICVSAPVKRAGTVRPSLFLPKFSLCFLAHCRKQRALKSSRLRSGAMKAPVGLLSDRTVLRSKMEGRRPDKLREEEDVCRNAPGPSAAKSRTRPHPAPVSAQNKI
ncbi:hypothetical protein ACKVMQ_09755, partial [Faecalibacterium hattorii]